LPLTQENSKIIFAITGTDSMFDAVKPLGFLLNYVGLPSFGGFATYTNEYNLIRNKVYELLGGLIANDATQNTREIIFTAHSMGCFTSFKLYKELHEGQTYAARLGGVKAFCPFVWNDDITHDMRELCETALTRSEIEIFAIKDDYSSALLKVIPFGTISWYNGDGSLDYSDVNAFSQITQAIYKANANHTIDFFSPTDPINVMSSVPKADYGSSRSIKSVKQQDIELIWGVGTAVPLTLFTPLAETASAYFNVPHSVGSLLADATSDTQFGYNLLYASTYRNKYFYYDDGGQRYVSLLTNLVSHSNSQYVQYLYFERVSVTNGGQDYLIYTYDGTNKSYYKLNNGSFSSLLGLPDHEDGGGTTHTITRTEKASSGITQTDVTSAAALNNDNYLRMKFHIVPAIDSAYGPRRSVSSVTVPNNFYNVVNSDGTQEKYVMYHTANNSDGNITNFYLSIAQYAAMYGFDLNNLNPSTWWQSPAPIIDANIDYPKDESLWLMKSRFDVNELNYIVEINSTIATEYGRDFNANISSGSLTNTSSPYDQPTPADATYCQITDVTYLSDLHFKAKLRVMNLPTATSYFSWTESGNSNSSNGYYGNFNADTTQALGVEFTFVKMTQALIIS